MSHTTHLKAKAEEPRHGMTLGEIEDFVAQAKSLGLLRDHKVRATVGFRAQIQSLETK